MTCFFGLWVFFVPPPPPPLLFYARPLSSRSIPQDLNRKSSARNEYDAVIGETEAAYMKILESSQASCQAAVPRSPRHATPHLAWPCLVSPRPLPRPHLHPFFPLQTLLSVLKREAVSLSKRSVGPL